jgi:two-component system, LytTR family, response regulator
MIRTIIIDDEKTSREALQGLLKRHCNNVEVVAEADGMISGIAAIKRYEPDAIFLDIQMPDGSGFKMLEEIGEINFDVIFTTAYDQFAIKAIKYSALDYLLKPLNPEDLTVAVEKLAQKLKKGKDNTGVNFLLDSIKSPKTSKRKIILAETDGMHVVEVDDIIRCESDSCYTRFFLKNSKNTIVVSKTLKEYDEMLSEFGFVRPHKSHLINLKYVKSLLKTDGLTIEMEDGSLIPVSRRKREIIIDLITHL